jgi:copper(I)-binding protein
MKLHIARSVTACVFIVASSLAVADDASIHVRDAWIREAPPNTQVLAAYFTIENHAPQVDALTGVSSAGFGKIEIHRTEIKEGVARMLPQPELALPSHETVKLEPKGLHLMLMEPKSVLHAGDHVTLQLTFKNAKPLSIDAEVRKSHDGADHSHEHQHHH